MSSADITCADLTSLHSNKTHVRTPEGTQPRIIDSSVALKCWLSTTCPVAPLAPHPGPRLLALCVWRLKGGLTQRRIQCYSIIVHLNSRPLLRRCLSRRHSLDVSSSLKPLSSSSLSCCWANAEHWNQSPDGFRHAPRTENLIRLSHAFISSRFYYCNGLLTGLPKPALRQLQNINNTAARRKPGSTTTSPACLSLNGLIKKHLSHASAKQSLSNSDDIWGKPKVNLNRTKKSFSFIQ